MHFDDRLATVLRLPSSGDALARIQYRQLIDILGNLPGDVDSGTVDAGFARMAELAARISANDRARLVRGPLQPLSNPRLLALLAEAEPEVASAAIGTARLEEAAWLELVPALPVRARGILRHRRDLGEKVDALLARLGIHDRGLPPCPAPSTPQGAGAAGGSSSVSVTEEAEPFDLLDEVQTAGIAAGSPAPASLADLEGVAATRGAAGLGTARSHRPTEVRDEPVAEDSAGIGAIVRRIEEFRKAREKHGGAGTSTRLPLGDPQSTVPLAAMDFATDSEGRVSWAEGPHAGALIGLNLAALDPANREPLDPASSLVQAQVPGIALSMRHRQPLRAVAIDITGAPAVSGLWQVDAVPHFDPASGRFTGYAGRLRRPGRIAPVDAPPAAQPSEADRMRQVLHELRTPANAIQVAAEIIQQQLYGPAPHEYRALAAAIAGDCAHILAGFEELDRLVKLESGTLGLESGDSDLVSVLRETVARLKAWTQPRGSGFLLPEPQAAPLRVVLERTEVERLIWRLFAVLAGMTAPQEVLPLRLRFENGRLVLQISLPALLLARDGQSLFDMPASERGQSLSTGMFGIGFSLRLAAAEAAAAGGGLQRDGHDLLLSLPATTSGAADGEQDSEIRAV